MQLDSHGFDEYSRRLRHSTVFGRSRNTTVWTAHVTPLIAGPDWDYENNNMDEDLDTDDNSTSGLESSDDFGPFSPAVSFSSFLSDPSSFASDPSDLPSSRPSSSSDGTQTQGDYDQFRSPWQIAVLDWDWVWSAVDALGFAYNGEPSM